MKLDESVLIKAYGIKNYLDAKDIDKKNISLNRKEDEGYYYDYLYTIKEAGEEHQVKFVVMYNNLSRTNCTCEKFEKHGKCKHVVAAIDDAFTVINKKANLSMNDYYNSLVKNYIKTATKTNLSVGLIVSFNTDLQLALVKIKIGEEKLYSISNKMSAFTGVYRGENKKATLSKNFDYIGAKHTFSEDDKHLLDYIISKYQSNKYEGISGIYVNDSELKYIINLLGNKSYAIDKVSKHVTGYSENVPFAINLEEEGKDICFDFQTDKCLFLNETNTIAFTDNTLHIMPSDIGHLVSELKENDITTIKVNKKNATDFSKKIHTVAKDKVVVADTLKEEFEILEPKVKMFFDLTSNVESRVVFDYQGKEVSLFDKDEAFRNNDFENNVMEDLLKLNFIKKKNKLVIEDINMIVEFIEQNIFDLRKKYEIYTTEKFNAANIVTNLGIKSQFGIGQDNIMRYNFELGEINPSELNKILDSMTTDKKYYKLKNGNIISLEDKSLQELQDVCEHLNLDSYEETGIIPKYRALYLDSVKNYSIVETDNTFNEFIDNFNKNKNSEIKLKKIDSNTLREYQLDGVRWMYNIYKCGFGGILADEMGLGKTIQTIMFIKNVLKEKPKAKILVVAPTSLIYNWGNEFNKFGKELSYKVVADGKGKRIKALEENCNIFITTYGLIRQDIDVYKEKEFELVIIDEAQNIKNPKAGISSALKQINTNSKIALTGTPIENSIVEIWSIFDFLMPGYLNSLATFQSKYNVKDIEENLKENLKELNDLIKPFILRRKKKDVLVELPDKIENTIYLDFTEEQKKMYAAQVKKTQEEYEKILREEGFLKARFKILQLLTKLRQMCIHPQIAYPDYDGDSVKMNEIVPLLQNYIDNGHKILIFTSFKTALDMLKARLDENGITNFHIDGSVSSKERNKLVETFNKDNTNTFLITLKSGGTGLNLTSADVVIHLDLWWNPQAENQATDRAHRIGQKNKVEVIKLVCSGTIEEKILELQNKKKILNDALIDNGEISESIINKLDESDIKNLLSLSE